MTQMFWCCLLVSARTSHALCTNNVAHRTGQDFWTSLNFINHSVKVWLVSPVATCVFAGRGKMGTFKRLKSDRTYQEAFLELGRAWTVSDELFKNLEEITCHMYVPSTHTTDVNLLRYQLFCTRRGEVESSQLPPCQDCLFMHLVHANYQAAIWRRSLQTQPSVPNPKNHGWTTNDEGQLDIQWMRGSPAPDAVLQLLSCKCVRLCKLPECTCFNNGLKCTNLCKLQTCANQCSEEEPPAHLTDSDVDEDTDVD